MVLLLSLLQVAEGCLALGHLSGKKETQDSNLDSHSARLWAEAAALPSCAATDPGLTGCTTACMREAVVAMQDGCGDSAHSRAWDTCSCPLSCFLLDPRLHLSENKEHSGERLWRTVFARSVSSQLLSPLVCQALTGVFLGVQ